MKILGIVVTLAIVAPSLVIADPIYGVWKTVPENNEYAHVEIAACGADICGVITKTFSGPKEFDTPFVGKKIVWGLQPNGGGQYSGGRVWRRTNGKTYALKMALSGNNLALTGCFLGICQSGGMWTRVK